MKIKLTVTLILLSLASIILIVVHASATETTDLSGEWYATFIRMREEVGNTFDAEEDVVKIIQNGNEIFRTIGKAQVGGEFEKFTFGEDQTGPTIIKFENIRNTGQETEFGIVVAPEFGTITLLVLAISIISVAILTRKNSFRFNI